MGCERRHAPEACAEDFRDLKKSERVGLGFSVRGRRLTFRACRSLAGRGRWKIVIERLCLSLPYVKNPFNSKVIKSFVPELRSRKCFLCFGIPMLSIYVRYEHSMYISHIHIWLCNNTWEYWKWIPSKAMREKNQKRIPQTNKKASRNQIQQQKSLQVYKVLGGTPCKILGTNL